MLDLQHQYNNCTTIPRMRMGPTYWGPPSCEGLLYNCCIGVVQESNSGGPCEELLYWCCKSNIFLLGDVCSIYFYFYFPLNSFKGLISYVKKSIIHFQYY
jgi:hypothetical protein